MQVQPPWPSPFTVLARSTSNLGKAGSLLTLASTWTIENGYIKHSHGDHNTNLKGLFSSFFIDKTVVNFLSLSLNIFVTLLSSKHQQPLAPLITSSNQTCASFSVQFSSVTRSCPTLCNPMDSSTPGFPVHHQLLNLTQTRPSSQWCHSTISCSIVPFSSHLQTFPVSGSFPMSQFFASGGQSIGVSA